MSATLTEPSAVLKFNRRHFRLLAARAERQGLPGFIAITDGARGPEPEALVRRLPRGAGLIFRHYGLAEARVELARRLARLCRRRGVLFLVAGDAALAHRVGADGVHLPEFRPGFRRAFGHHSRRFRLVTAAAHSRRALVAAARRGAGAALLSPLFPTASHPAARPWGPVRFAALVREAPLPVYALGGITPRTLNRTLRTGAVGVAAISGLGEAPWSNGRYSLKICGSAPHHFREGLS